MLRGVAPSILSVMTSDICVAEERVERQMQRNTVAGTRLTSIPASGNVYIAEPPVRPMGRKGRNMGKYIKGNIDEAVALGTLAGKDALKQDFGEVMVDPGRVTSIVSTWAMEGFGVAAGDGPVRVGVAHSDYSAAEIEEWIENAQSWDLGDKIGQEVGKRLIREIGVFRASGQAIGPTTLNEGRPIKTKLNWRLTVVPTSSQ